MQLLLSLIKINFNRNYKITNRITRQTKILIYCKKLTIFYCFYLYIKIAFLQVYYN